MLPLLFPLFAIPLAGPSGAGTILLLVFALGGHAYLFFAPLLYWWLGGIATARGMRRLVYCAPLLYLAFQVTLWVAMFYLEKMTNPALESGWEEAPTLIAFVLVPGYLYVGLVMAGYHGLRALGGIREAPGE